MDWTSRLKILAFLSMFVLVVAEKEWERYCTQCVGGDYLKKRWLMQHDASLQSMAWVDAWYGTDCHSGKVKQIGCDGSCLTVEIHLKGEITGIMKDCSDELISQSPDLPQDIDFRRVYRENASFKNDRLNHTIKYTFSTIGILKSEHVVPELKLFRKPTKKSKEMSGATIGFFFFAAALILGICIVFARFACSKKDRHAYQDVPRSSNRKTTACSGPRVVHDELSA